MQPQLIHKPAILLVGMSFYGDPFDTRGEWMEENQIGRTWKRFMAYMAQHGQAIQHPVAPGVAAPGGTARGKAYDVHIYGAETLTLVSFEVFVGLEVERLENVPLELLVKVLPATQYAVFTLQGEAIFSDWTMHIDRWLTQAGFERAHPYSVQYYDERFKGLDRIAESSLDVWMPVRALGAAPSARASA